MDPAALATGAAGIYSFAVASYLSSQIAFIRVVSPPSAGAYIMYARPLKLASYLCLTACALGYVVLLAGIIQNPQSLVALLNSERGAMYVTKAAMNRVPGISSLAQLAIVYILLLVVRARCLGNTFVQRWEFLAAAALASAALLRSFSGSERLSFIEIALPVLLLYLRTAPARWPFVAIAPVAGFILLMVVFLGSEYFRTWSSHYRYVEGSFIEFGTMRLLGYYVSALDTGAGFLARTGGRAGPVFTMQWFWQFPLDIGQQYVENIVRYDTKDFAAFIYSKGNPQFNNTSGIYMPYVDFGHIGGTIMWATIGVVCGVSYRAYRAGTLFGLLYFPLVYVFLIELPRVFSWGSPRYFIVQVAMIFICLYIAYAARRSIARPVADGLGGASHSSD